MRVTYFIFILYTKPKQKYTSVQPVPRLDCLVLMLKALFVRPIRADNFNNHYYITSWSVRLHRHALFSRLLHVQSSKLNHSTSPQQRVTQLGRAVDIRRGQVNESYSCSLDFEVNFNSFGEKGSDLFKCLQRSEHHLLPRGCLSDASQQIQQQSNRDSASCTKTVQCTLFYLYLLLNLVSSLINNNTAANCNKTASLTLTSQMQTEGCHRLL